MRAIHTRRDVEGTIQCLEFCPLSLRRAWWFQRFSIFGVPLPDNYVPDTSKSLHRSLSAGQQRGVQGVGNTGSLRVLVGVQCVGCAALVAHSRGRARRQQHGHFGILLGLHCHGVEDVVQSLRDESRAQHRWVAGWMCEHHRRFAARPSLFRLIQHSLTTARLSETLTTKTLESTNVSQ